MTAPTVILAAYDPGSLRVQWTLPEAPPSGLTGFQLIVTGSGGYSAQKDAAASATSTTVDADLSDASQTYQLTVSTLINGTPGDKSAPLDLIAEPLDLLLISYDVDPDSLSVRWTPPVAPATGGLATLAGQGSTANKTGSDGVSFAVSLSGGGADYTVTVRPIDDTGVVQGPPSVGYNPITNPLSLGHAIYDLSPDRLTVSWIQPSAPATEGLATLDGGGSVRNGTGATGAEIDVSLTGTGADYDLTLRAISHGGKVQGPTGTTYHPIAKKLGVFSAVYDLDPDTLTMEWAQPAAPATEGLATLNSGGSLINKTGATGAVINETISGDGSGYILTLRAISNGGRIQGPSSPVYNPITTPLDLTVVYYDLSPTPVLTVEWNPLHGPATHGIATLSTPGKVATSIGEVSAPIIETLEGDGSAYTLTTRAVAWGGVIQGPATPALTPIAEPLSLISLVYDLSPDTLSVRWAPPTGPATHGMATLVGPSLLRYADGVDTATMEVSLETVLPEGQSYSLTIRPTDGGKVLGPASEAFEPIAAQIDLNAITYDTAPSESLTVAWGPLSGNAEEGLATLSTGSSTKNLSGASSVSFATQAATSDTVTARQTAKGGKIQGPATQAYNPIVETTSMTLVSYDLDPDIVTATWQAGSGPGIAYLALLIPAGGTVQEAPVGTNQAEFSASLPATGVSTVAVRITDADNIVRGPLSDAVTALVEQVTGARLVYLNTEAFRGSWAQLQGITDYLYRFNVDGTPGQPTAANTTTATISQAIAGGKSYTLQARATGAKAQGPWSAAGVGPYLMNTTASHDPLGRLTEFDAAGYGSFTYTRDAFGNILSVCFVASGSGGGS